MRFFTLQYAKDRFKVALASKDWNKALEVANQIWASGERNASVCLGAQRAARALSDLVLAEAWVDRGFQAEPDWRLLRLKGDFHSTRREWKEARALYEKALEIAPHEPVPNALLGKTLFHLEDYAAAVKRLRFAVKKEPKSGWYHSLGMCELRMGNILAAKVAFTRANELEPKPNVQAMIADLERRLELGDAVNATAQFYDDVYSQESNYRANWRDSIYVEIWVGIIEILKANSSRAILDLGCGPGQFACCVAENLPGATYHGVDFSEVAVELGKKRVPSYKFSQLTLPVESYQPFAPFDTVICTEVLEHIEADLPVLQAIPSGVFTLFSVPNFDSFGHVRVFKSATDVHARYGPLFERLEVKRFELGKSGGIIWLGVGTRCSLPR